MRYAPVTPPRRPDPRSENISVRAWRWLVEKINAELEHWPGLSRSSWLCNAAGFLIEAAKRYRKLDPEIDIPFEQFYYDALDRHVEYLNARHSSLL